MSDSLPISEADWHTLMGGADPLFMSHAWRQFWWELWGERAGTLAVLTCADDRGLLGLAPLYRDRLRLFRVYAYLRLQLIGCSYGALSTPRAEYNSFLLRAGSESRAFDALAQQLEATPWQELVLQDVIVDSPMDRALLGWSQGRGWVLREILQDQAYAVNTEGSFETYLATLGSNTRLKLFNRRKLLATLGAPQVSNMFPERVDAFFDLLNAFHRERWGADCFGSESLSFHKKLIHSLAQDGAEIDLSLLSLDEKPLSVLYNVRCKERVYNLQSGYLERFHPKISLGSLHLGYAIEAAFHSAEAKHFDMLAGRGKQSDYKRAIANEIMVLKSYKVVRSRLLRGLYWVKDFFESYRQK